MHADFTRLRAAVGFSFYYIIYFAVILYFISQLYLASLPLIPLFLLTFPFSHMRYSIFLIKG